MKTEDKKEERPLAPWQKELQKKFNKESGDKKEILSQDAAKKLLGDGLIDEK